MKILRVLFVFLYFLIFLISSASHSSRDEFKIKSNLGQHIILQPLDERSIRVRVEGETDHKLEELIYIEESATTKYDFKEDEDKAWLSLPHILLEYDKNADILTFQDSQGNIILKELINGRTLHKSEVQGETTTIASQKFYSPQEEELFGTGQFQDGYLNIKGLTRRLTQVNTQIAIPFVLSTKGYGFLWNNYGLTEYNPSKEIVRLTPTDEINEILTVDVTTTIGNAKEERHINSFEGFIDLPEDGEYSFLLDVGQTMARKHKVSIDDVTYVDFNNLWLPPTTSFIARMSKGQHKILVEGEKNDKPIVGWRKVDNSMEWKSPVSSGIDYTVIAGNPDEVISSYRSLTGKVPMPPKWALGYIHCRERYNTQSELLDNAIQFRRKGLPIDVIVQDWQYWGKYGWNAMRFDEEKYPDPAQMTDSLHSLNIKLMLSVWAKLDVNSDLGALAQEKGYLISGSEWVDFFNQDAADFYWNNSSNRLMKPYGIDAWWQDATEPENDDLRGRRIANGSLPGEVYGNVYPLVVNRAVYGGLRKDNPDKRVMILTRSAFPGIQRYGVATWSGDVGYDWEVLRRQIVGGLGQMATGIPWWTFDAGGFFRPGDQYVNERYHELLIRWIQCSAFLPLMRVHGYMSNTEPWRYGESVDSITRNYINLRYQLLPYTYSSVAKVAKEGYTLMRPLVMDYWNDKEALQQKYQFMFGPSILVSPVTEALPARTKIYLPAGQKWIDFWTGEELEGGIYVEKDATISEMPLYVKAGSIIPLSYGQQYACEKTIQPLEIRVYCGADGEFMLYEDEGDGFGYEQGLFSNIVFRWDDGCRKFSVMQREGHFPNMDKQRDFKIVTSDGNNVILHYDGHYVETIL